MENKAASALKDVPVSEDLLGLHHAAEVGYFTCDHNFALTTVPINLAPLIMGSTTPTPIR